MSSPRSLSGTATPPAGTPVSQGTPIGLPAQEIDLRDVFTEPDLHLRFALSLLESSSASSHHSRTSIEISPRNPHLLYLYMFWKDVVESEVHHLLYQKEAVLQDSALVPPPLPKKIVHPFFNPANAVAGQETAPPLPPKVKPKIHVQSLARTEPNRASDFSPEKLRQILEDLQRRFFCTPTAPLRVYAPPRPVSEPPESDEAAVERLMTQLSPVFTAFDDLMCRTLFPEFLKVLYTGGSTPGAGVDTSTLTPMELFSFLKQVPATQHYVLAQQISSESIPTGAVAEEDKRESGLKSSIDGLPTDIWSVLDPAALDQLKKSSPPVSESGSSGSHRIGKVEEALLRAAALCQVVLVKRQPLLPRTTEKKGEVEEAGADLEGFSVHQVAFSKCQDESGGFRRSFLKQLPPAQHLKQFAFPADNTSFDPQKKDVPGGVAMEMISRSCSCLHPAAFGRWAAEGKEGKKQPSTPPCSSCVEKDMWESVFSEDVEVQDREAAARATGTNFDFVLTGSDGGRVYGAVTQIIRPQDPGLPFEPAEPVQSEPETEKTSEKATESVQDAPATEETSPQPPEEAENSAANEICAAEETEEETSTAPPETSPEEVAQAEDAETEDSEEVDPLTVLAEEDNKLRQQGEKRRREEEKRKREEKIREAVMGPLAEKDQYEVKEAKKEVKEVEDEVAVQVQLNRANLDKLSSGLPKTPEEALEIWYTMRMELGIRVQQQSKKGKFGLKQNVGVVVRAVSLGTAAEQAGMKAGDVVKRFNNRSIKNHDAIMKAVSEVRPGQTVHIQVSRYGVLRSFPVVVGARNYDDAQVKIIYDLAQEALRRRQETDAERLLQQQQSSRGLPTAVSQRPATASDSVAEVLGGESLPPAYAVMLLSPFSWALPWLRELLQSLPPDLSAEGMIQGPLSSLTQSWSSESEDSQLPPTDAEVAEESPAPVSPLWHPPSPLTLPPNPEWVTQGQFSNPVWSTLFEHLSKEMFVSALEALLAERSVVLLSSHYSLLTLTAEALLQSIQPFQWNYLYIPVLPIGMLAYLQSPFPLLMTVVLDLDADCVIIPHPISVTGAAVPSPPLTRRPLSAASELDGRDGSRGSSPFSPLLSTRHGSPAHATSLQSFLGEGDPDEDSEQHQDPARFPDRIRTLLLSRLWVLFPGRRWLLDHPGFQERRQVDSALDAFSVTGELEASVFRPLFAQLLAGFEIYCLVASPRSAVLGRTTKGTPGQAAELTPCGEELSLVFDFRNFIQEQCRRAPKQAPEMEAFLLSFLQSSFFASHLQRHAKLLASPS